MSFNAPLGCHNITVSILQIDKLLAKTLGAQYFCELFVSTESEGYKVEKSTKYKTDKTEVDNFKWDKPNEFLIDLPAKAEAIVILLFAKKKGAKREEVGYVRINLDDISFYDKKWFVLHSTKKEQTLGAGLLYIDIKYNKLGHAATAVGRVFQKLTNIVTDSGPSAKQKEQFKERKKIIDTKIGLGYKSGTISLQFLYIPPGLKREGCLCATVLSCANLDAKDVDGTSDRYVKMTLNNVTAVSQIIKSNLNPIFNYDCQFVIPPNFELFTRLHIEVWDYDKVTNDNLIGTTDVILDEFIEVNNRSHTEWKLVLPLLRREKPVVDKLDGTKEGNSYKKIGYKPLIPGESSQNLSSSTERFESIGLKLYYSCRVGSLFVTVKASNALNNGSYVKMTLNGDTTRKRIYPDFDSVAVLEVPNDDAQLHIEVWNHKIADDELVGSADLPLCELITANKTAYLPVEWNVMVMLSLKKNSFHTKGVSTMTTHFPSSDTRPSETTLSDRCSQFSSLRRITNMLLNNDSESMRHESRVDAIMNKRLLVDPAQPLAAQIIPSDDVKIFFDRKIGEGTFGTVYKGTFNDKNVAVKILKSACHTEAFRQEAYRALSVKHPNIVESYGVIDDNKFGEVSPVKLVMELLNGSLQDRLHPLPNQNVPLSRNDVIQYALDIAGALRYLHSRYPKIIHRDLTPANVLFDKYNTAKLSDFGTARLLRDGSLAKTVAGTLCYMAPEVLEERLYDEKADIYSFGAVLYEMITGMRFRVRSQENERIAMIKENISDKQLQQIVIACCMQDPNNRPNIEQCVVMLRLAEDSTSAEDIISRYLDLEGMYQTTHYFEDREIYGRFNSYGGRYQSIFSDVVDQLRDRQLNDWSTLPAFGSVRPFTTSGPTLYDPRLLVWHDADNILTDYSIADLNARLPKTWPSWASFNKNLVQRILLHDYDTISATDWDGHQRLCYTILLVRRHSVDMIRFFGPRDRSVLAGIAAPDKQRMNLVHGRSHPSTEPSLPGKGFGKRFARRCLVRANVGDRSGLS